MLLPIRVYYEDTDCGGVVYYANYLKYFERGRTELLRERGVDLVPLHERGVVFVVVSVSVEYLSPCRYGDLVLLETELSGRGAATLTFKHTLRKEGSPKEIARGTVVLASCRDGKPARIPGEIIKALKNPET